MSEDTKRKVIVMGRNYTSLLGMIRAAGVAGCEVYVIHTVRKFNRRTIFPDKASKFVKRWEYAIEPDQESLMEAIRSLSKDIKEKVMLLPTDDFTAAAIDDYASQLKDEFLFSHTTGQYSVVELMDKNNQKKIARSCGLPVAPSCVINVRDGRYQIPEDVVYPCFPKPEISFMGDKECMKKCENEQDLRGSLDIVASKFNCPVLVEQYNPIDQEYGVLGVSDGTGVVIPALVEKLKIGHGAHEGVTLLGKLYSFEKHPEIRKALQEFVKELGFVGLFDIDLYESNGQIYFNEINLRLGAFGFSVLCAGINLPGILIDGLTGGKQDQYDIQISGEIVCISEKVNYEDYAAGMISRKEYRENQADAEYGFLKVPYDMKPYRSFREIVLRQTVKKAIKRK